MMQQNAYHYFHVIIPSNFSLCAEYFLIASTFYLCIAAILIKSYNEKINLQNFFSELCSIIFFFACYIFLNDDIFFKQSISFHNSIVNDYFGIFAKINICFFSGIFFLFISDTLRAQNIKSFEYLAILNLAILGLLLLCSSNDLITAYLTIELTSFSSYILAAYKKNSSYSVEAGLKYFIIGSVSSAFILLGISLIYALNGSIVFSDIKDLLSFKTNEKPEFFINLQEILDTAIIFSDVQIKSAVTNDYGVGINSRLTEFLEGLKDSKTSPLFFNYIDLQNIIDNYKNVEVDTFLQDNNSLKIVEIGLIIILLGVFIKLALAPFHTWSLDVYEGSPTSSTFFFAVITKLSLFVFLIRLCHFSTFFIKDTWQFYSILIAITSVIVGSFGGLRQKKVKTLLAYSSISHMGFILLAFGAGSVFGIKIIFFYLIVYMVTGACTWYFLLILRVKNSKMKYSKELGDLVLLKNTNPALALAFIVVLFSTAGVPPLVGFLAKFGVFLALLKEKFYFVCLIAVLCSVVSTFYYIRLIKTIYFENTLVGKLYYPIRGYKPLVLSFLVFLLTFIFIDPSLLFLYIDKAIFSSFSLYY